MSLSVQQILSDAKKLASRLRDHEVAADNLISQEQNVCTQVNAMKEYQEDCEALNLAAGQRSRNVLALGIQQESRHLRALQQENRELRGALEDHQRALELIMSKYRLQVSQLIQANSRQQQQQNAIPALNYERKADEIEKVMEMIAVMKKAMQVDDVNAAKDQELIVRLQTENKGLRDMLGIAKKSGSLQQAQVTQEKEVQTDPSS